MALSDFGRMLLVGAICLKIGSALAEWVGQGEVGGCTPLGDSAWRPLGDSARRLLQLAVEKPWSAICLLSCSYGRRKRFFHFVGTPFLAF